MALAIIVVVWLSSGVMAYALTLAHFAGFFPTVHTVDPAADRRFGAWVGMFGPFGLVATVFAVWRLSGFRYGLKWW